jgi:hypothetical protein
MFLYFEKHRELGCTDDQIIMNANTILETIDKSKRSESPMRVKLSPIFKEALLMEFSSDEFVQQVMSKSKGRKYAGNNVKQLVASGAPQGPDENLTPKTEGPALSRQDPITDQHAPPNPRRQDSTMWHVPYDRFATHEHWAQLAPRSYAELNQMFGNSSMNDDELASILLHNYQAGETF